MSAELTSKPESTPPLPLPVNMTARGLEALKQFEKEIAAYRRELPRLLQEQQAGKFVLIKEDQVLGVYDTWPAANEAGLNQFGLDEPFCVQKVDARDPERYALLDAWNAAQCRP